MTTYRHPFLARLKFRFLVLAMGAMVVSRGQDHPPQFVKYQFVGENFFTGFFAMSTQWVAVEVSSDLVTWTNMINYSTGKTNPIPFVDDTASTAERRFYRVRSPGITVDQARSLWQSHNLQDYRYHIEITWYELAEESAEGGAAATAFVPSPLPEVKDTEASGIISVREGVRTISEAALLYDSEPQPVEEISADDFPTFEDLYDWLDRASQTGALRLRAQYHPELGFPVRGLNQHQRAYYFHYTISDFEILGGSAKQSKELN